MVRVVFLFWTLFVVTYSLAQEVYIPSSIVKENAEVEAQIKQASKIQYDRVAHLSKNERKVAKDIIGARAELIEGMLKSGNFIFNTPLNTYVEGVLQKIIKSNPDIDPQTTLLISRSGSVNAFTTGDGFLVMNMGLLVQLESESELAFVIGHELGHQSLDHVNQKMRERIEVETDTERAKELKRILYSEYQVRTKLKEFVLPGMIASRQFQRKNEFEADSLGLLYAINSGFTKEGAREALRMLDSVDVRLYKREVPLQELYDNLECETRYADEEKSMSSSLGGFKKEEDELEDLLRTHPDCDLRLEHLTSIYGTQGTRAQSDGYKKYRTYAHKELIETYVKRGDLGTALYHAVQLYFDQPQDSYAIETAAYCLATISLYKKQRKSREILSKPSIYRPKDYGKFIMLLWDSSSKECYCIANRFNDKDKEQVVENRVFATRAFLEYLDGNLDAAKKHAEEYNQKYPDFPHKEMMETILNLK